MSRTPERRRKSSDDELRKRRDELKREWYAQNAEHGDWTVNSKTSPNVERQSNATDGLSVAVPDSVRAVHDAGQDVESQSEIRPPKLQLRRDRRAQARYSTADIAMRAYELFEQRGGEHGHDWDDWYRAERELRQRRRS